MIESKSKYYYDFESITDEQINSVFGEDQKVQEIVDEMIKYYGKQYALQRDIEVFKEAFLKAREYDKLVSVIKTHKLFNYVLKNKKCAKIYKLTDDDLKILAGVIE